MAKYRIQTYRAVRKPCICSTYSTYILYYLASVGYMVMLYKCYTGTLCRGFFSFFLFQRHVGGLLYVVKDKRGENIKKIAALSISVMPLYYSATILLPAQLVQNYCNCTSQLSIYSTSWSKYGVDFQHFSFTRTGSHFICNQQEGFFFGKFSLSKQADTVQE